MSTFALHDWEIADETANSTLVVLEEINNNQSGIQLVTPHEFPDLFSPEQIYRSESIEDSIEICAHDFNYARDEVSIARIGMEEDLKLLINGKQYSLTEKAYIDICNMLRIPNAFFCSIPTALAALIVEHLAPLQQQSIVINVRDDVIVGLTDPAKWSRKQGKRSGSVYKPVPNIELLHLLEKVWRDHDVKTRITLSDSGLQVELVSQDEKLTIEPQVGDITQIGIAINNSETGGPLPHANGYTWRLVCRNGSTVPNEFADVRFSSDTRYRWETRMAKFSQQLEELTEQMEDELGRLKTAYHRMTEEYLRDAEFYNLYRQAQYLFRHSGNSSEDIDRIFRVDTERRNSIIGPVRERQNQARKQQRDTRNMTAIVIEPSQATDILAWDVFNGITEVARDEAHYQRRIALEGLASHVMQPFIPEIPESLN